MGGARAAGKPWSWRVGLGAERQAGTGCWSASANSGALAVEASAGEKLSDPSKAVGEVKYSRVSECRGAVPAGPVAGCADVVQ